MLKYELDNCFITDAYVTKMLASVIFTGCYASTVNAVITSIQNGRI